MKLGFHQYATAALHDAPHTGARLETFPKCKGLIFMSRMPPTRGHDLKLALFCGPV